MSKNKKLTPTKFQELIDEFSWNEYTDEEGDHFVSFSKGKLLKMLKKVCKSK